MAETVYTIQFDYDGKSNSFTIHSHYDYSKGTKNDQLFIENEVKSYFESNNLDLSSITNIRFFGKGGEFIFNIPNLAID